MVELLVVLGIVALATAVLLPAVQTVRRTASTTTCADNLRTLGQAITGYVNDHQFYPYGYYVGGTAITSAVSVDDFGDDIGSGRTFVWWSVLRSYVEGGGAATNNGRSDDSVPFSRINALFNCPGAINRSSGVDYVPNAAVMVQAALEMGSTIAHPINRARNSLARATGVYSDTVLLWDAPERTDSEPSRKEQYAISYSIDAAPNSQKALGSVYGLLATPKKPSWRYRNVNNANRTQEPKNFSNDTPIYPGINEDVTAANSIATTGGIRFRHGANNEANFLFADGSVRTHAMTLNWNTTPTGTLLRKYFRSKLPPGHSSIDTP